MNDIYHLRPSLNKSPKARIEKFYIHYEGPRGVTLNAEVNEITEDDFEVFIQEKEVIIHCSRDEDGAISCHLTNHGNPDWVNGICNELTKKLLAKKKL